MRKRQGLTRPIPTRQRRPAGLRAAAVERGLLHSFDGLGSTVALSDTSGAKQQGYSYEPYGAVTLSPSSGGPANPWRYAGSYQDPTALYKMGDRYYLPGLMPFTQQDPLRARPMRQINRYAYVGGDPVNRTDPTGRSHLKGDGRG